MSGIRNRLLAFGPLPLRIMIGVAFIIHGYPKLLDIASVQGFFGDVGIAPGLALPIALLEFIGGITLILGIITRISSILLAAQMIGATLVVKLSKGFVGGYELDLLLMAGAISLIITGPGRASIEWDVIRYEIFPAGKKLARG